MVIQGFSFSGGGSNTGTVFIPSKDWSKRKDKDQTADTVVGRAFGTLSGGTRDVIVFPLNPPSTPELGNATGFTLRLQDRVSLDRDALVAARNRLLGMAA